LKVNILIVNSVQKKEAVNLLLLTFPLIHRVMLLMLLHNFPSLVKSI
jgi:hypothetical protein